MKNYEEALADWTSAMANLRETASEIMAERNGYEAALRKIVAWQGYRTDRWLSDYERGANEMLENLKQMAEEALS